MCLLHAQHNGGSGAHKIAAWCPISHHTGACADAVDFGVRSSRSSSAAGGIKPELFDIVLEHISQNDGAHKCISPAATPTLMVSQDPLHSPWYMAMGIGHQLQSLQQPDTVLARKCRPQGSAAACCTMHWPDLAQQRDGSLLVWLQACRRCLPPWRRRTRASTGSCRARCRRT